MDDNLDELMAENIANGFYEPALDEEGNFVFRMSANAREINPDLYAVTMRGFEDELIDMVQKGLLKMDFLDDGTPVYGITDFGKACVEATLQAE